MQRVEKDGGRDYRISMEAIVDAYGADEQAMGWYSYLEEKLSFPFQAQCVRERVISPLKPGELITVMGMAPEDESMHEMFVMVQWQDRQLAIPLSQVAAIDPDESTAEAIGDWHYWVARGYQFG